MLEIDVGKEMPFLDAKIEARHAPLPMMAHGGDRNMHLWGGDLGYAGCQPLSHRGRTDATLDQASLSAMLGFTLCWQSHGPASCHNADPCLLISVGLLLWAWCFSRHCFVQYFCSFNLVAGRQVTADSTQQGKGEPSLDSSTF
jgi:hypothetical protein